MPSYGQWITPDDYQILATRNITTPMVDHDTVPAFGKGELHFDIPGGPFRAITIGDITLVTDGSGVGGSFESMGVEKQAIDVSWGYVVTGTIPDEVYESDTIAKQDFGLFSVSAYEVNYYDPPFKVPGGMPANAIGWQWQADMTETNGADGNEFRFAEAQAAVLEQATLKGGGFDTSSPDLSLTGSFSTYISAGSGSFESDSGPDVGSVDTIVGWDGPLLGDAVDAIAVTGDIPPNDTIIVRDEDIDLTPHLDELGRLVLFTKTTPGPVPFDLGGTSSGGWHIGYGFWLTQTKVRWTLRPPVFRWIYATRTPAPPLRRKQRDDNAINNNRNGGHTSSRQRSLRNAGYL